MKLFNFLQRQMPSRPQGAGKASPDGIMVFAATAPGDAQDVHASDLNEEQLRLNYWMEQEQSASHRFFLQLSPTLADRHIDTHRD